MMKVLDGLAPETLAEPWDQVGLHVGSVSARVRKVLLCIDLTEAVLDEAKRVRADMVVAYHPPLFKPLARLTDETGKGGLIWRAARQGISVYSPHTALDAAEQGVNDHLVSLIGPGRVRPISSRPAGAERQVKLVMFVPKAQENRVRNALSSIGVGVIGDYEACSFVTEGHGTFRGLPSTNPAVGRAGELERVAELRLEMVLPKRLVEAAVGLLRSVHPYEEPAFDLIALEEPPETPATSGQGRILELRRVMPFGKLVERLKKGLKQDYLKVHRPGKAGVRRIGLCAGAGASLLGEAGDIDVFFTGEMRHHDALEAVERGVGLILAGHTQTERCYLPVYRKRIVKAAGGAVEVVVSKADRPPVEVI